VAPPAARAAGGGAARSESAPRKRDTKSILLWGGLFLANSALLTIGLRDRAYYDDAAAEAEALGGDASGYREGYDRAGVIVAASGVAALVSGVGFLRALRGRPASPPPAGPLAGSSLRPNPGRASEPAPADDPIAKAIEDIEARSGLGVAGTAKSRTAAPGDEASASKKSAPGDRPAPIVMSRVRKQQAWYPGTMPSDTSVAAGAAAGEGPKDGTPADSPAIESSMAAGDAGSDASGPGPAGPSRPFVSNDSASSERSAIRYSVQVASYRRPADARADSARWTERGYPTRVVEKDLGKLGVWYRVVIGDFPRSADAESLADWLRGTFPRQDARVTRR
jgi:hypothetical protein